MMASRERLAEFWISDESEAGDMFDLFIDRRIVERGIFDQDFAGALHRARHDGEVRVEYLPGHFRVWRGR